MGRRKNIKVLTGPVVSDATGPGGDGDIPASTPSSSSDGCEEGGERRSPMETESQAPKVERPAAVLSGLDWEKDLAGWWDEVGAKTPTAELFHIGGFETIRERADDLDEAIDRALRIERPDMVTARMKYFIEEVRHWTQEHAWVISELTRRECVRYGEEAAKSVVAVPDNGKEVRDQGTEMEDEGMEAEIGAPVMAAPLPGELGARLEDMSSRLAANSDRLELLERRLLEVESDRAGAARGGSCRERRYGDGERQGVGEVVKRGRKGGGRQ